MNIDELSYFGKELEKTSGVFKKAINFAFKKDIIPKKVRASFVKHIPEKVRKRVGGATHSAVTNTAAIGLVTGGMIGYSALKQPRSIYSGDGRFER